jgi:D-amino-acid dehydrogenase
MNSQRSDIGVDILVIGGGVVGTALAAELCRQGRKVVMVEKGQPGNGCSYANAGWVTPCFAMPLPQPGMFFKSIGWLLDPQSPLHIQPHLSFLLARWMFHFLKAMNKTQLEKSVAALTDISKYSLEFYSEFSRRSPNFGFENRGLLLVSANADGLEYARKEQELMAGQGIEGRYLERDELLAFESALKPLVQGGIFFPQEAQVEPYPTVLALLEEFKNLGGESRPNTEVYEFEMRDGRIEKVITTQGNFRPDLVVLAAGSWSTALAKQLGTRIPVLGGKGYSMNIEMKDQKPERPIMIVEKKIAITPRANSIRVAGTLELVDQDHSISPQRVKAIQKGAAEYLHLEKAGTPTDLWRGLRPCTPDGVPVIGPSQKISNLFYCAGHQLLGLQSAPGSARLAAELITGRDPFTDPRPFRAGRFE